MSHQKPDRFRDILQQLCNAHDQQVYPVIAQNKTRNHRPLADVTNRTTRGSSAPSITKSKPKGSFTITEERSKPTARTNDRGRGQATTAKRGQRQLWENRVGERRANNSEPANNAMATQMQLSHRPKQPQFTGGFKCGLEDCTAEFAVAAALKRHKYYEHADSYCEKCDLDFISCEKLLKHKAGSDQHIACPFDGMEFKSEGGLAAHMEQSHPCIVQCECPACSKLVASAAALMEHFEEGQCPQVSVDQFVKMRIDRTIRGTTAAKDLDRRDPDDDADKLSGSVSALYFSKADAAVGSDSDSWGDDESRSPTTVHPRDIPRRPQTLNKGKGRATETDLRDVEPFDAHKREGSSQNGTAAGLYPWQSGAAPIAHEAPSGPELRSGKDGIITEASLRHLPAAKREDIRRLAQIMWGGMPLRSPADMFDISGNGIPGMNPWSVEFNAEYFRGAGGFLQCPYQSCKKLMRTPERLRAHLKTGGHAAWAIRCPQCHSAYHQASQLVSHFETATRCKVKDQPWFGEILEIASSGFVGHDFLGADRGHRLRAQRPQDVRW